MSKLNGIQFSVIPSKYSPSFEAYDPSVEGEDKMVGGMYTHPENGTIEHIVVRPSHQRRGIATQLYELAKIAHHTMPDKHPMPQHSPFRTYAGEMWAGSVDPEHERPDWDVIPDEEVFRYES